jgi:CMP/dCMP kinase
VSEPDRLLQREANNICLQVAIDGPAGSGKSTVGRVLARELGCTFLDTGLMYRAVTLLALERGIRLRDAQDLANLADSMKFEILGGAEPGLRFEGRNAEASLHSPAVDAAVSEVSAHGAVRAALVERQRQLANARCIVMVGRDIGTVVLPDADVKLWVTASAPVRARRRLAQEGRSSALSLEDTLKGIVSRDLMDQGRPISPLKPARDAVPIDTSQETVYASVARALDVIRAGLRDRPTR